jgi:fatty-acyl-CoA synthase
MNLTSNDKIALSVPLYHCFGMVLGNLAALNYGSTIVQTSSSFKSTDTLQAVS